MAAQKKPLTTWDASDLGVESTLERRTKSRSLFIPQKEVRCKIMPGETEEELGVNLALKLREKQVI